MTTLATEKTPKARVEEVEEEDEVETMDVDVVTPKKKKSSSKKKKSVRHEEEVATPTKKRKAPEMIVKTPPPVIRSPVVVATPTRTPVKVDTTTPVKVVEWLEMIDIAVSEKHMTALRREKPALFRQLVYVMTNEASRGFIFSYLILTPIGRMFFYAQEDGIFKSVHDEFNIVRLTQYDKEADVKITELVKALTAEQRAAALALLGVTEEKAEGVTPGSWLFALIENNVLERRKEKPDYKQNAEPCIVHDVAKKESFFMCSKLGKSRLQSVIIVSRARAITEKNIEAEYALLDKKRADIEAEVNFLFGTPVVHQQPKKKKKQPHPYASERKKLSKSEKIAAKAELEAALQAEERTLEEKVKHDVQTILAKQLAELPPSSDSDSEAFSFSEEEEEEEENPKKKQKKEKKAVEEVEAKPLDSIAIAKAALLANMEKKKRLGHIPVIAPNAITLAKSLEVKRNIEDACKTMRIISDRVAPEIAWFRENCS